MLARSNEEAQAFLGRLVRAYNSAVRAGDFTTFVALFTDDATLEIEGVPEGPIAGRAAIAAHYRETQPDDEIRVMRWKAEPQRILAEFCWSDIPEAPGGCFILEPQGDKIARLTIALGGPDRCWR